MEKQLVDLLRADHVRWRAMDMLESLDIPTACIGAGFVRNLVWDHLHDRSNDCRQADLDVLWFDPDRADAGLDLELEQALISVDPSFNWSVKNQARMHIRNQDAPYTSVSDAMRHWPETATAIAVQRRGDECHLIAPFGLSDLMNMILRPTSSAPHKLTAFADRARQKEWSSTWPKITFGAPLPPQDHSPLSTGT